MTLGQPLDQGVPLLAIQGLHPAFIEVQVLKDGMEPVTGAGATGQLFTHRGLEQLCVLLQVLQGGVLLNSGIGLLVLR